MNSIYIIRTIDNTTDYAGERKILLSHRYTAINLYIPASRHINDGIAYSYLSIYSILGALYTFKLKDKYEYNASIFYELFMGLML